MLKDHAKASQAVFPLAKFSTIMPAISRCLPHLPWPPWSAQHRQNNFFVMVTQTRWLRQVQQRLWHVTVADSFAYKLRQCKPSLTIILGVWDLIERVINTSPGDTFTTLYFLCNLEMGPYATVLDPANLFSLVLNYTRVERIARDKHPSLLGTFVSQEENQVL